MDLRRILFISFLAFLPACEEPPTARSGKVVVSGEAQIGGDFTLVNQDGDTVTDETFYGRPQLIYFGFSYCPDVCPLALQKMGVVLDEIDPDADYFQPIFITIDPQRDTSEALAQYVTANTFPSGLVGLTGSQEQIDQAAAAYKVYAQKVPDEMSQAGYTMDHTDIIYLMDKNGEFVTIFTGSTTPGEMARTLKDYRRKNR